MAAPSFIAKGTVSSGSGASVTPAYPGGIVVGDVLFLLAVSNQLGGSIGSIDGISGWTLYDGGTYKNSLSQIVGSCGLFYKIASGAEVGTVTVTRGGDTGGATSFAAQIYQYRGGSLGASIEVGGSMNNTGDGNSTITWNAITVGGNERTLVALLAQQIDSSPGAPAGYSSDAVDTISAGSIAVDLDCNSYEDVGSDGAVTVGSGTSNGWVTFHLSLFSPSTGRSFIIN